MAQITDDTKLGDFRSGDVLPDGRIIAAVETEVFSGEDGSERLTRWAVDRRRPFAPDKENIEWTLSEDSDRTWGSLVALGEFMKSLPDRS